MSNMNKWNDWYKNLDTIEAYGDSASYKIGADFLFDCNKVEDWGCGKGWFRKYLDEKVEYVGLDGSVNKFVDKHVDLETYISSVDGLFMRHVLEHNYNWKTVLQNALNSFKRKMVLVIFTPWSDGETRQIGFTDSVGVPDISFSEVELTEMFSDISYEKIEVSSDTTAFGKEYIFLLEKD